MSFKTINVQNVPHKLGILLQMLFGGEFGGDFMLGCKDAVAGERGKWLIGERKLIKFSCKLSDGTPTHSYTCI